ncbi:MAG: carboxypeptidase-like regulatory domain-containing protein [Acidobacteriota bacterium]|nr:carboxypeptidase-like regulatory domain-containing protein [Acidobacteriota bacterium]
MTRTDKFCVATITVVAVFCTPALHAQVSSGVSSIGRSAARAIATRSTTSAARAASALSSLGSGSSVTASRVTSVMGYLWAGEGTPVSNASVQLRNLVTGQVEQVSSTLQNGAFAFNNVPGGTYAIEMMTEAAGRVVAVGQAFSVAPGETVATFVRLGSKVALLIPDLASSAATAVVSNATNAVASGVVASLPAVIPPAQPASPLQ